MNRPKIDDYVDLELKLTEEGVFDFVTDLISYCDELEKALDNACDMLETYDLANNELTRPKHSKEEWKEWLLKDE